MKTNPYFDLSHLTADERIRLACDLRDSLTQEDLAQIPLTAEQEAELERRMESARLDPKAGCSWEEVREHALEAIAKVRGTAA